MSTKSFFIDLHGCAKNQVDAEIIIGIMQNLGWKNEQKANNADLIIINSCGFIEPAKKESINAVIDAKNAYPNAKILLAGCLAERYADNLKENLPEADAIFGNGDLLKLPRLIQDIFPTNEKKIQNFKPIKKSKNSFIAKPLIKPDQIGISCGVRPKVLNFPRSAYIKITEGCDNFCSFCAIPIIRGRLRSRSIDDVVTEIQDFIQKNYFEFNLIGQDLAVFQTNNNKTSGLSQLLTAISKIKGNFRIRLLYIHPDHFPLDILPVMVQDIRFLPYFDIPFQSGSEKIIKLMNRKGSSKIYLDMVKNIKKAFKDANSPYGEPAIRTTFLVGFPGETDIDFEETAIFLKELKTLWSGGFVYSKEEDTPAYSFKNKVPKKIAKKRLEKIQTIQQEISAKKLDTFIGSNLTVLVEELLPKTANSENDAVNLAFGRAWFQAPDVDGVVVLNLLENVKDLSGQEIKPGSIVQAKVIARKAFDLEAVVK